MMVLNIKGKEYKVKFGYNSFCDTDLMDRTTELLTMFSDAEVEDDKDITVMGKIKDLFSCVRELLFVGFKKYNPVETVQEIGELLDDYHEESTEDDKRGLFSLFTMLAEELTSEGFFSDLMETLNQVEMETENAPKAPQDHKKPKRVK